MGACRNILVLFPTADALIMRSMNTIYHTNLWLCIFRLSCLFSICLFSICLFSIWRPNRHQQQVQRVRILIRCMPGGVMRLCKKNSFRTQSLCFGYNELCILGSRDCASHSATPKPRSGLRLHSPIPSSVDFDFMFSPWFVRLTLSSLSYVSVSTLISLQSCAVGNA
jgi:hypothetical protein